MSALADPVLRNTDGMVLGLTCLLVVVVCLLLIPMSAASDRRRMRRVKRAFLRSHQKLPAEEFLRRAGAEPGLGSFYLAGRQAMANLCRIRLERIHPED